MNKFYVALLFVFAAHGLQAQNPGGVSTNLSVWLKADNTSTLSPTTGSLNSWTYSNNGANAYTAAVGQQPTVAPNTFNFLPSIAFNGTQFMTGPSGASAPIPALQLNYTVYAVWSSTTAAGGSNERIWVQRQANGTNGDNSFDGAAFWVYPSNNGGASPAYGDQPEISPFTTGALAISGGAGTPVSNFQYNGAPILPYAQNTQYISEMQLFNANTNDLELMDQSNYAAGGTLTSTDPQGNATVDRVLSTQANLLGARSASIDEPFFGNLAELIIYSGNVTAAQRTAIFSYLSLKYGISLGGNYVSSAGSTIWDATANGTYGFGSMNYNHNVFGIGEDLGSGLTNTHSNSLSTAGVSNAGNIILANPSALADQGFMLVGSNNAGFVETTSNLPLTAPAGSERLPNQWLIQNTGTVGAVDLSFDFTGITTTGTKGTNSQFRLIVDNDGDGDFTTGTQTWYEPSGWDGTNEVATFSQVTLTAGSKTVIAILSNAPVNTPLPVNWVNFTAKANGPDVDLNWTVTANENAKVYDVQRSADGSSFTSIGQVSNDPSVTSYGYVDANAGPGTHYYRVLETDQDGKSIYSKIVSVNMSGSDFGVRLLNNPVVNGTDAELEITAANAGNASVEIWGLGGTRVATMMQEFPNGTSRIRLPMANLAPGAYAVKIRVNDVMQTVQVVKL